MMNNKAKKTGSFKKVLKLISVLQKCNGKAVVGDSNALISPKTAKIIAAAGIVLLTGLLTVGAYFVEPLTAKLFALQDFTKSLMMIMLLLSFILSIKNIVTVLYTADDLSVLLPMPFSEGQIVAAKLAVSLRFPIILSLILINSLCLGFGLSAGMGAAYIIGTMLSSVLVPITGLAIAVLLVVIVFRVFGFIRNRDITIALSGVFTLALTIAYIFVSNNLQDGKSAQAAAAVFSALSSVSGGFPNIAFMTRFMFSGDALGLLISIGISAAALMLAMLAVKLFYLSTALSMQNTGANKRAITKDDLRDSKKVSVLKALSSYEAKSTRRNPSYLIYGFAMTFIWPLLFVIPLVIGNNMPISEIRFPLDIRTSLLGALFLGLTASCFACGFNVLPITAFSREGKNFDMIRTLPIDFTAYCKSKRDFSLLICSLGSVGYIIIAGIVCAAIGVVPTTDCWTFLYGAGISFLMNLIIVDCMLLKNSRKPRFDWDSETELSRKLSWINIVAVIVGVITLVALLLAAVLSTMAPIMTVMLASIIFAVIVICLAAAVNKSAIKRAAENLMKLE